MRRAPAALPFGCGGVAAVVDSGTCGNNLTWTLDEDGTLTISGTGEMEDYSSKSKPWEDYFGELPRVKKVIIKAGVTSISANAFEHSPLESIEIANTVTKIGKEAFVYAWSLTSVSIPDSVQTIGESAFKSSGLTSVTIPDSVRTIGDSAFSVTKLTSVTIPDSVQTIGKSAFNGCSYLTSVRLPAGLTEIDDRVFYSCSRLSQMTIPDSVTRIGKEALRYCNRLPFTSFPASLRSLDDYALLGVAADHLCIPASLTEIGDGVFSTWSDGPVTGVKITVSPENKNFIIEDGLLYTADRTRLLASLDKKTGTVTLPQSVTQIDSFAFTLRPIEQIILPDGLVKIGERCFYGSGLKNVTIPDSVTTIGQYAFSQCYSLTEVTISASVNQIDQLAFSSCRNLRKVVYLAQTAEISEYGCFDGCPSDLTFYCVKDSDVEKFAKRKGYKVVNIEVPLTTLTLPAKLKTLESEALSGCAAQRIVLPAGLTSIGKNAFADCPNLEEVVNGSQLTIDKAYVGLGDNVKVIGK